MFTMLRTLDSPLQLLTLVFCFLSDTDYLRYIFPQFVKSNLYHLCYTGIGQRISICNYWNGEKPEITFSHTDVKPWHSFLLSNIFVFYGFKKGASEVTTVLTDWFLVFSPPSPDPHHRDLYVNSSDYLALLNSERANPNSTGQHIFLVVKAQP